MRHAHPFRTGRIYWSLSLRHIVGASIGRPHTDCEREKAVRIIPVILRILYARGEHMKEEEKKPLSWEVKDPKPPIIQSGRMENRRQQDQS